MTTHFFLEVCFITQAVKEYKIFFLNWALSCVHDFRAEPLLEQDLCFWIQNRSYY